MHSDIKKLRSFVASLFAAGDLRRWTKPWRADGEGFIAFTQGTDIVKGSPDKSGSSTNKMKLTSGIFLGCAVAAYLNVRPSYGILRDI
jgi:hypothetical protein